MKFSFSKYALLYILCDAEKRKAIYIAFVWYWECFDLQDGSWVCWIGKWIAWLCVLYSNWPPWNYSLLPCWAPAKVDFAGTILRYWISLSNSRPTNLKWYIKFHCTIFLTTPYGLVLTLPNSIITLGQHIAKALNALFHLSQHYNYWWNGSYLQNTLVI